MTLYVDYSYKWHEYGLQLCLLAIATVCRLAIICMDSDICT